MEFKTISRNLVEYLRAQIITGELKPGQKLNENDLALYFNISRHPLREAFRILENDNLLISNPRKGVYVSEMSVEDLEHLYQVREMAECYAIELLEEYNIRELPDVALALSTTSNMPLPRKDNAEELMDFINADAVFHKKLIEVTDNSWLIRIYNSMYFHIARYLYYLHMGFLCERQLFLKEHQRVLEHIQEGSFDKAKELMRSHLKRSFNNLRGLFLQVSKGQKPTQSNKP